MHDLPRRPLAGWRRLLQGRGEPQRRRGRRWHAASQTRLPRATPTPIQTLVAKAQRRHQPCLGSSADQGRDLDRIRRACHQARSAAGDAPSSPPAAVGTIQKCPLADQGQATGWEPWDALSRSGPTSRLGRGDFQVARRDISQPPALRGPATPRLGQRSGHWIQSVEASGLALARSMASSKGRSPPQAVLVG